MSCLFLLLQGNGPCSSTVPWGGAWTLPTILCQGTIMSLTKSIFAVSFTEIQFDFFFPLCIWCQFVFKPEPYSSTVGKTIHEELTGAMTAILKPSTDFLTSNKLLKVTYTHGVVWSILHVQVPDIHASKHTTFCNYVISTYGTTTVTNYCKSIRYGFKLNQKWQS